MAFTTQLVLAAQTGPGVELIQDAVTTGTSTSWSKEITLPAGRWLVVVNGRSNFTNTAGSREIVRIDGTDAINWNPGYGSADLYTPTGMRIVTGGRAITINAASIVGGKFTGNSGWDIYAARIPD